MPSLEIQVRVSELTMPNPVLTMTVHAGNSIPRIGEKLSIVIVGDSGEPTSGLFLIEDMVWQAGDGPMNVVDMMVSLVESELP